MLVLVVTVAVVGGAIWFVGSRQGDDDSDRAAKVDTSVTTTAAPAPTTSATTTPGKTSLGDVGPTSPAEPTGSKAKLCVLSAEFDRAIANADQVDAASTPEEADAIAEKEVGTWMRLMAAAPEPVFSAMTNLFAREIGMAYWVERAALVPDDPGIISPREDWQLQKAANRPPTSEKAEVATVRAYLASC